MEITERDDSWVLTWDSRADWCVGVMKWFLTHTFRTFVCWYFYFCITCDMYENHTQQIEKPHETTCKDEELLFLTIGYQKKGVYELEYVNRKNN